MSHDSAQPGTRYDLVCAATDPRAQANSNPTLAAELDQLGKLIRQELLALARQGSPDHFAELYLDFERELERFSEFCAYPGLAQKVTVGFGGAFSSGKSSLINALIGERLLVVNIDPTTSLPCYILHGDSDDIHALNLYRQRIPLSREAFQSLTHEETLLYGSHIGRLLRAAFITLSSFPWHNLAFIDTPGYSKPDQDTYSERTDENLARAQLNAAQIIIWAVHNESGGITEDDLSFLASLKADIPRLIVITHADKKTPDDMRAIVAATKRTLAERNLPHLDVIPVSNRNKSDYPLQPILDQLQNWNTRPNQLRFAHNFKALFTRYTHSIAAEQRQAHWQLNRLNRILTLSDDPDIQGDSQELQTTVSASLARMQQQHEALHTLRARFFTRLKRIGDQVGIPLPEPDAIDLLDDAPSNLLEHLRQAREQRAQAVEDQRHALRTLSQVKAASQQPHITRKNRPETVSALSQILQTPAEPGQRAQLLRLNRPGANPALLILS